MDKPMFIDEFLVYIGKNPEIKPTERFKCRAMHAYEPPTFFNTMPKGDLFVYPKFLVFFTLTDAKPGYSLIFKEFVQEVAFEIPTLGLGGNIEYLEFFRKHYSEEKLAKVMTNPNSFCIPLSSVTDVETGFKLTQGAYIKIILTDASFIIYRELSNLPWRVAYQLIVPTWRNFVEMLKQVALTNSLRR